MQKSQNPLRKLSKLQLLELLAQQERELQTLRKELAEKEAALADRRIQMESAGSIAEAAVDITNVFSAAQTTANLYLHEISCMKEDTERECAKMLEDARKKVEKILDDGKKQSEELEARYQRDYQKWYSISYENYILYSILASYLLATFFLVIAFLSIYGYIHITAVNTTPPDTCVR